MPWLNATERRGDEVAPVVGVGIAEDVEDFDGAVYVCQTAVEQVTDFLGV